MQISDDELFGALREMRQKYPDWRLGQMIANLATWTEGAHHDQIWDIEDSELVETARRHLQKRKSKQ